MLAYVTLAAAIAFWLGIKASRFLSASLNKHYASSFYVPRNVIQMSEIGDCEITTVAISKDEDIDCETVYLTAYGFNTICLELDSNALKAEMIQTRFCLHDFAILMPFKVSYDEVTGRHRAMYRLPKELRPGQSVRVWFFN